jgi:hypothetical protein
MTSFFKQSAEDKMKVTQSKSKYFNGYSKYEMTEGKRSRKLTVQ